MADASASEMKVIVEIASREIESGGWGRGGNVVLTVSPKTDGAAAIQAKGTIAENTRSTVIKVPLAAASPSGWRLRVRISGVAGQIEDEMDVMPAATALVGEPTVFRAGASPRAPLQPMADFQFRRTERVHVEWPAQRTMDNRSARLLNKLGEPLPIDLDVAARVVINERTGTVVLGGDVAAETDASPDPRPVRDRRCRA